MDKEVYARFKKDFTAWASVHEHNMLVSFPKSGRNYFGTLLRRASGKIVINGIPEVDDHPYEDVFIFICHRGRWDIVGDQGKYIMLVRDPRDAILSRTYQRSRESSIPVPELLGRKEWLFDENILEWVAYFQILLPHDPLVIQYEHLCLDPEKIVLQTLTFLEATPFQDLSMMIQDSDLIKPDPHKDTEMVKTDFFSGRDRYNAHCLKWQKDPYVTEGYLDAIWTLLGELMEQYGYTETGHEVIENAL